jgi:hypothetical protein
VSSLTDNIQANCDRVIETARVSSVAIETMLTESGITEFNISNKTALNRNRLVYEVKLLTVNLYLSFVFNLNNTEIVFKILTDQTNPGYVALNKKTLESRLVEYAKDILLSETKFPNKESCNE